MTEKEIRVLDYLDEFVEALRADLERGEEKWGDTWLHRPRKGQEQRIRAYFNDHFDRFEYGGTPMKWESIAGEAMIAWIRVSHPDIFPE